MKKAFSQEIDEVFQGTGDDGMQDVTAAVAPFDLSHLDRIPKSQLRAIHLVHENFVRNLGSSLSAYLRSYIGLNLVSLEQISYSEFVDGIAFPTGMAYISMTPFEGTAVLEMNMVLMFTLIEIMMGSKGRAATPVQRKITDIEKSIMQTLLRVILRDLKEAWNSVAKIDFAVQSLSSEPQLMHVLAPAEAVIVIAVDVRIGTVSGLMNLAIPSIFIKRLRHKFDQLQTVRKASVSDIDPVRISKLIQDVPLDFSAVLDGGSISTRTLLDLEPDNVLVFDHPIDRPVRAVLNEREKWNGKIVATRNKLAFQAVEPIEAKQRKALEA
jgi:flagellar motor switch protein FliM